MITALEQMHFLIKKQGDLSKLYPLYIQTQLHSKYYIFAADSVEIPYKTFELKTCKHKLQWFDKNDKTFQI